MTGAPVNESCVGGLTKTGCVGTRGAATSKISVP